uniref:Putative til domain protein n=1 Tax=Ixodes ricinus TaxID=34613 RepID=A0A0K8RCD0_IXORI
MKILFLVFLVVVTTYMASTGATTCGASERAVSCNNWNERNKSCHEGTCYYPEPLGNCKKCQCHFEDDDDCETQCVCVGDTLRQPDGTCRDPSDCPNGSPGSKLTPDGEEDKK